MYLTFLQFKADLMGQIPNSIGKSAWRVAASACNGVQNSNNLWIMIVTLHEGSINDIKGVWAHSHCVPFFLIFFSVETRKAKYQRFLWRPRNPKKQNKVYTSTYFVKHIYHRTKIRLDLSLKKQKKTSRT